MTDYALSNKIQDWAVKSWKAPDNWPSVADACLQFMLQPPQIIEAVKNDYWMSLWLDDVGYIDGDMDMPPIPDWTKIHIEVDGE